MTKYLMFLLLFLPLQSICQFTDSFADGNFSSNPVWQGNETKFIINNANELQLFDETQLSPSYLSTESNAINGGSWEFLVKFSFNPSSSNYADVFLCSNNQNLNEDLNGYYVKIGNTADEISLYRKDGSSSEMIIDGTDKRLDASNVNVRIKVNRDNLGNWELYSDTLGGRDYYLEGTVFDDTYTESNYFGINCIYTSSRWNAFFFDDFIVTDNSVLPEIIDYEIIDEQTIAIDFNKELDETSALNTSNYQINNQIGSPFDASFGNLINTRVILSLNNSLVSGTDYIIYYQNISDANGNENSGSFNLFYFVLEPGMIVINEIMRNAEPSVGLPEGNYVEIYNTTDFDIDISNWVYQISIYTREFPFYILESNNYLILCADEFAESFEEYGNVLSFESFPAMNNSGQTITLFDNQNNIIDKVEYSETWYEEAWKREGGWSLEKIDPNNNCGGKDNWKASIDTKGGTPGYINSIDDENLDNTSPFIESIEISSANELTIVFSERVLSEDSENLENYDLNNDFGSPIYIQEVSENISYILQFPSSFMPNIEYVLTVKDIRDFCNNILEEETYTFSIFNPIVHDVLITEIMAKPDPPVQLPDAEYIEIYNSTDFSINLKDWIINAGSVSRTIDQGSINPKSYTILCHSNNVNLFTNVENVIGVESFPSLSNSGALLSLQFKNGNYIHTVRYSDSWIKDEFKKIGGWSLEMIDINNPCETENNWKASVDNRGGTPGEENSVKANNPDAISPFPIAAKAISPDSLTVWFNEILLEEFVINANNYFVEEFGNPIFISATAPEYKEVKMKFNGSFEVGKVYYLDILDSIMDCSENMVLRNTAIQFGLADSITEGDLVINEILFNPFSGSDDFVEVYNRSNKLLDLNKLWISNRNKDGEIANSTVISNTSRLIKPKEYCAITTDLKNITDYYFTFNETSLYETTSLPSMPNSSGSVIITDRFYNIIDEVNYDEKQHYKLLVDVKGVSLERINFDRPSNDSENWHSAAESVGFATPGYENSQYTENKEISSVIEIYPEVFSPDNDGYNDILNIAYSFDEPGYSASISIYNSKGVLVKKIVESKMLGSEGYFYWDGFDSRDNIAPIGLYILYAEMFNLSGNKIVEKHVITLSKKIR